MLAASHRSYLALAKIRGGVPSKKNVPVKMAAVLEAVMQTAKMNDVNT